MLGEEARWDAIWRLAELQRGEEDRDVEEASSSGTRVEPPIAGASERLVLLGEKLFRRIGRKRIGRLVIKPFRVIDEIAGGSAELRAP